MLHPSYADLMSVVNSEVEPGEEKIVNSRYSIVMATAKRARQLLEASEQSGTPLSDKPVKLAINDIASGKVRCKDVEEVSEENAPLEETEE